MGTAILYLQDTLVELMINISSDGKLEVFSKNAIGNSLCNGSSETFREIFLINHVVEHS